MRWTKEGVRTEAQKYTSKIEWITQSPNSYFKAKRKKWIKEFSSHMRRPRSKKKKWTKEAVFLEAKKYKNKKEWENNSGGSYNIALKNKWVDEASTHMKRPIVHNKKWTKETILLEAKKYKNKGEWQHQSGGSFLAAYKNDCMEEASCHMKSYVGASRPESEVLSFVRQYYPTAKTARFPNKDNNFSFKRLEIDIYIPELKRGIEFDGTYHHSYEGLRKSRKYWKEEEIKNYHQNKDLFFKKQGIELLHISVIAWNSSKDDCFEAILKYIGIVLT